MCEKRDPVCPRRGEEYVRAVQALRRSSAARPYGSLRGRNRQNEKRRAVLRSERGD